MDGCRPSAGQLRKSSTNWRSSIVKSTKELDSDMTEDDW